MRTLGRILIILLAALVVVGAAVVLVDNGALGGRAATGLDRERPSLAGSDGGERPAGLREGRGFGDYDGDHDGEREGSGGSFLAGLIKNLGTVALIVTGVVLGQWLWSRIANRRPGKGDSPAEAVMIEKPPDGGPS